jgi:hypothetical protein
MSEPEDLVIASFKKTNLYQSAITRSKNGATLIALENYLVSEIKKPKVSY